MKLFLLSGLGADSRVFDFLELPGIEKVPVKWIPPSKDETISEYTQRLSEEIKPFAPVNLLGVSFGGFIAQELANFVKVRRLFIVSSLKSSREMGLPFHITKRLGLFKLFGPARMKKGMSKMGPKLFGLKSDSEIKLFRDITMDTDEQFLKWAVRQIHKWEISDNSHEIIHIHGTKDKMFPVNKIRNYIPIHGGGHFMIVNRAQEISQIILEKIS